MGKAEYYAVRRVLLSYRDDIYILSISAIIVVVFVYIYSRRNSGSSTILGLPEESLPNHRPASICMCLDDTPGLQLALESGSSCLEAFSWMKSAFSAPYRGKPVYLLSTLPVDLEKAFTALIIEYCSTSIPEHRILFCSGQASKVSILRQIQPVVYLDTDSQTIAAVSPYLQGTAKWIHPGVGDLDRFSEFHFSN